MKHFTVYVLILSATVFGLIKSDVEYAYESPGEPFDQEVKEIQDLCSTYISKFLNFFESEIDLNTDGFIDKDELYEILLKQTKKRNELEIQDEFEHLGLSGDQQITFEKYAQKTFEDLEKMEADADDEAFLEMKNVYDIEKKKWNFVAGQETNGALNRIQFYSFVFSEEFPHIHEYEKGITFNQFDANSDGSLDVKEFWRNIKYVDDNLIDSKTKRFTSLLDLDGNNALDRSEFQLWYNPSLEEKIKDEIDLMLEDYDEDQDGLLNKTEITKHCETISKIQLTDYGSVFSANEEKNDTNEKIEL